MLKAYTLRPEYEDTLVGGSVVTGPEAETMDIMDELKKGGGEIVTESSMLQSILENYYGEHGLVFQVSEVVGDGRKTIEREEVLNASPPDLAPPTLEHRELPPDRVADVPAEHNQESEYSTFTVEELRDTLGEREIQMPSKATKPELIAALEQDDTNREGASSGS